MTNQNNQYIRLQFKHDFLPVSKPYPGDLEQRLSALGLPFIGGTEENTQEAIIRHETGPEIILLVTSVLALGTEILKLYSEWKKTRPETKIQITVSSAKEFEKVLNVLKAS